MIILSLPQPLAFISLGNSERPREKKEPSKPFLFSFFLGWAGRCFTGCRSSFVFPFFSEGLFGKVGCVNMRGYQKEMKLDCSRVCSFLWQHAAREARRSRRFNRLRWGVGVSDLWPKVWQVSKFSMLSILTPFLLPRS